MTERQKENKTYETNNKKTESKSKSNDLKDRLFLFFTHFVFFTAELAQQLAEAEEDALASIMDSMAEEKEQELQRARIHEAEKMRKKHEYGKK